MAHCRVRLQHAAAEFISEQFSLLFWPAFHSWLHIALNEDPL